jgi:hypothetical protein
MNVPNIGQGLGSVTALPRTAGEGDTAPPRAESVASGRAGSDSPRVGSDFARLAWFDVNGDGHIDPRSAAAGGDATLLVPHAVDLPVYSRNVSPSANSRTVRATPGNAAQTNRAVDAYQRYGQVSAPAHAPTPSPAPALAVHLARAVAPAAPAVVTPERAVA